MKNVALQRLASMERERDAHGGSRGSEIEFLRAKSECTALTACEKIPEGVVLWAFQDYHASAPA